MARKYILLVLLIIPVFVISCSCSDDDTTPFTQQPTAPTEPQWYVAEGGQTSGPFTAEELKARGVSPTTQVVPVGQQEWVPASTVPGLSDGTEVPVPATPTPTPVTPQPVASPSNPFVGLEGKSQLEAMARVGSPTRTYTMRDVTRLVYQQDVVHNGSTVHTELVIKNGYVTDVLFWPPDVLAKSLNALPTPDQQSQMYTGSRPQTFDLAEAKGMVAQGMSKEDVREMFGQPSDIRNALEQEVWIYHGLVTGSTHDYFAVSFGEEGVTYVGGK